MSKKTIKIILMVIVIIFVVKKCTTSDNTSPDVTSTSSSVTETASETSETEQGVSNNNTDSTNTQSSSDNSNNQSQQQSPQNSTSSISLDQTHQGLGYTISYPSSFMTQQGKEAMFAVLDPASGSNVTVMNITMMGNFNDLASDKETMEVLFANLSIGTIESKVKASTLNGYKCYECQIKTYEGAMTNQYITGDDDSMYLICIGKGNGITSSMQKFLIMF